MSSDSSDEPLSSRCKRRKRIPSSSDEDTPIARRKRHRILTDSDDDSDSSVGPSTSRRSGGALPLDSDDASTDNDSITDWATDASDSENEKEKAPIKQTDTAVPATAECQSDSSDGNSEKCPICLLSFSNQDIGTPETCEHLFCSDCITEWSKNVNTCPVDRLEFKTILVRRKIGGKVIKRIPVTSRTPSEDYLFQEEPTFCEVCESSGSEETMLLCDTCDLGFHMHCLQPPLNEVPENEWHCPQCSHREQPTEGGSRRRAANASEASSSRTASRVSRMRGTRSVQSLGIIDLEAPSTSQQQIARFAAAVSATVGRRTAVRSTAVRVRKRKRRKRRSARAVVVEYELKDGEKFPIKRKRAKVVRRRKKKKAKQRVPRTAARRNMVRSWVRGRLAEQINGTLLGADLAEAQSSSLAQPRFSLFGARDQLEYFPDSDEEQMEMRSGSGASAVAIAPRSFATAILDSHRQIRRKRVSIPSPAYASSAPDILSGILESQTLLHSKNSSVSVRRDGTLNIKVPHRKDGDRPKQDTDTIDRTGEAIRDVKEKTERKSENIEGDKKIDIRDEDSDAATKKAPAYPGSGRGGGGGWRGGGGQRDYQGGGGGGGGNNYARGGSGGRSYGNDSYGGGNSNYRDGGNFNSGGAPFQGDRSFPGDNPWQNEGDFQNGRQQRDRDRDQYNPFPERVLMPPRSGLDSGRGRAPPARFSTPQGPLRPPPSWINRSLPDASPFFRQSVSDFQPSSGGYPAEPERQNSDFVSSGVLSDVSQAEYLTVPAITGGDAPPQPPIIRFLKPQLSEDERSDDGAEEGDKYDPTEPTLGDSGSEDEDPPSVSAADNLLTIVSPPRQELELVADYGSGSESPVPMRVSPEVLDLAVQQVLREHRDLISGKNSSDGHDQEDAGADSEGDCPNFSIYSAASMGMVKNNSETVPDVPPLPSETGDEDLVQEDDPGSPQAYLSPVRDDPQKSDSDEEKIKSNDDSKLETADNEDEDLNQTDEKDDDSGQLAETDPKEDERKSEKETRAPIKIVLASPSCVKKSTVDLYDKDDLEDETASEAGVELEKDDGVESEKVGSAAECDPDKDDDDDDDDASTEADPQIADVGKFTESISDGEDERSYTPCLDENKSTKSKDTTLESEKEAAGIEGLDTEMISDDEGNELFNDPNNQKNDSDGGLPEPAAPEVEAQPAEFEEGEIVEKGKLKIKEKVKAILERPEVEVSDDDKKKKKRKPDGKDKSKAKGKRALDNLSFKKLSKSGKERNYRERDDKPKNTKLKEKRRSRSAEKENKEKKDKSKDKKKEKRKDIERYDVRNVISDKSRRVKDVFGRDTSRPRSKSPDSRPGSAVGRRSPSGPLRSVSRSKRSASKVRRSPSLHRTSSIRGRRSASRIKRSISRGRKSASRERKSVSPRFRRSVSPRTRRSPSPRRRKSISLKRRSVSPRGRSPPNRGRRSISPRVRRSKSPRIRRSLSRGRNKRKRSLSRGRRLSPRPHRGKSPRRRPVRRSRSKLRSLSRNRSRSPKNRKPRKPKRNRSGSSKRKISRSPVKSKIKRKRSGSFSPGIVLSRSPSRERLTRPQWQQQQQDKSPLYQDWTSGSQSMSPSALMSPGWTPPPVEKSPEPRNLRVILTTKDKSKKKDKKKKTIKRNKAADRVLKRLRPKETGPSKEVFTSGNNILVSVSFNKNQNGEEQPVMPPPEAVPKKKKRKGDPANKAKKDKNKTKKKRSDKNKRTKDLENKKPVAIIDLDRSPFKELTPSPKAVIVLSDSENGEKEEELMERQEMLREELMGMGFPHGEDSGSPPRSLAREAYVSSAGPKTPPEPAVKFTIQSKSNPQLRAVNPLHEEEDEAAEDEEVDARGQVESRSAEAACKGPNTPPEPPDSPPSSPDAYDPFEPTKSGSATPERVSPVPPQTDLEKLPEKRPDIDLLQVPGMSMSLEAAQKSNLSADDVIQSRPISPREKVLALLKSTRNSLSPAIPPISTFGEATFDSSKPSDGDLLAPASSAVAVPSHSPERLGASVAAVKPNSPKLIYSSVTPTVVTSTPVYPNLVAPRITAFGSGTPPSVQRNTAPASQRTMLPSPAKSSPLKLQTNKLFLAKPSPIKSTPIKPMPAKSLISKLPLPSIKPMPARKGAKNQKAGQNGNEVIDLDMDMDSPYSPGSSDFGDLFEPPSDNGKHASNAPSLYPQKQGKFDGFDSLFNAKARSNNKSSSAAKVTVRQMKKTKGKTQVGVKMDEDSLKILDDLPSSAVEMQVKTKFLKKLNRQERVVDEVKLVLKPHYNKKHVTKEEYKDILRRAVPKICHNRSGEINPAKIQALIEAYVRKFRKKAHQVK